MGLHAGGLVIKLRRFVSRTRLFICLPRQTLNKRIVGVGVGIGLRKLAGGGLRINGISRIGHHKPPVFYPPGAISKRAVPARLREANQTKNAK